MLPTSRPICGKDLDAIRQQFGLSTADALWLFGLSITKWMHIVRQAPDTPVVNPTMALLVRLLDQHPELSVIPDAPSVAEMLELFNDIRPTGQKQFSLLLGNEEAAASRWLRDGRRHSPIVARLLYFLRTTLLAQTRSGRVEMLEQWAKTVDAEAKARGVADVLHGGSWHSGTMKRGAGSKAANDDDANAAPMTAGKAIPKPFTKKGRVPIKRNTMAGSTT